MAILTHTRANTHIRRQPSIDTIFPISTPSSNKLFVVSAVVVVAHPVDNESDNNNLNSLQKHNNKINIERNGIKL